MLMLPLFPMAVISLTKTPLFQWTPLPICRKNYQPCQLFPQVSATVCISFNSSFFSFLIVELFLELSLFYNWYYLDINQCDPNPCNGHTCVDKVNEYKCQCKNGYSGDTCQIEPDYCENSPCKNNGTCFNSGGNYSCLCSTGYKGGQCHFQIGNFSFFYCQSINNS